MNLNISIIGFNSNGKERKGNERKRVDHIGIKCSLVWFVLMKNINEKSYLNIIFCVFQCVIVLKIKGQRKTVF